MEWKAIIRSVGELAQNGRVEVSYEVFYGEESRGIFSGDWHANAITDNIIRILEVRSKDQEAHGLIQVGTEIFLNNG